MQGTKRAQAGGISGCPSVPPRCQRGADPGAPPGEAVASPQHVPSARCHHWKATPLVKAQVPSGLQRIFSSLSFRGCEIFGLHLVGLDMDINAGKHGERPEQSTKKWDCDHELPLQ